jgi:hypothetical protein
MYYWFLLGSLVFAQLTIGPSDAEYDIEGLVRGSALLASATFREEIYSANPITGVLTITQNVGSLVTLREYPDYGNRSSSKSLRYKQCH